MTLDLEELRRLAEAGRPERHPVVDDSHRGRTLGRRAER